MPVPRRSLQGEWSHYAFLVLALGGASVGFGNLWRFPGLVLEFGGGAFVLVYLASLLLLGLPVLLAEMVVGRSGHQAPVQAFSSVALLHGHSRYWGLAGLLPLLGGLLLLGGLSVVAGWSLGYVLRALGGAIGRMDVIDATALFHNLTSDPERGIAWLSVFLGAATMVVVCGLRRGIEPFAKTAVPLMLVGMLVLVVYALDSHELGVAWKRTFEVDWSRLGGEAYLAALRHGFYSLAVGVGVAAAYAACLDDRHPLASSAVAVVVVDTLFALAATLLVVTLLEAGAVDFRPGLRLLFETLPMILGQMAGGSFVAVVLFTVLVLAALATAVALLEAIVASVVERGDLRRPAATLFVVAIAWVLAVAGVLSFSIWEDWYPLGLIPALESATPFELLNRMAMFVILPVAALAALVFVGWILPRETLLYGLGWRDGRWFSLCYLGIRFVAPLLLILVFLQGLNLIGP